MKNLTLNIAFLSFSVCLATGANAADFDWDITNDWSNSANPNGVWSFNEGSNPLPHVDNWEPEAFLSPQEAWARSSVAGTILPAWYQSLGFEDFTNDLEVGDIVVHTTDSFNGVGAGIANVTWTSPIEGTIDITGAVWMGRDIGRGNNWTLSLNGNVLSGGSIFSGDSYNRDNPFLFSLGSGGSSVLNNVVVAPGDVLTLDLEKTSAAGDFVGVRFNVQGTAVPEPLTILGAGTAIAFGTSFKRKLDKAKKK